MTESNASWEGETDRGSFFVGITMVAALKYNLDRLIAWTVSDRYWTPLSYFNPTVSGGELTSNDMTAFGLMALTAIPFVWGAVTLFVRRLNSIDAPRGLAVLALIPVVNAVTAVVLAAVPACEHRAGNDGLAWLPESRGGLAAAGLITPLVPALLATLLAIYGFEEYGFGLFVAIPFCSGLGASLLANARGRRSLRGSLSVAMGSIVVLGGALFAFAVEGVLCLLMAAPIGLGLAAIGGGVGHAVMSRARTRGQLGTMLIVLMLASPMMMGVEKLDETPPPLHEVTTAVVIDAPPEVVWDEVVLFKPLPEPENFWFRSGIAYPTHARIEGEGVGAVRYCEFSTGPFVEPITVWDEPRRLAFDVREQPRSMQELSPWGHIDAPHVDEFLRSERGEFRLTQLADGRTRLEGTTWYRHRIWPAAYWRLWSDAIIHDIHGRVFAQIERHAESPVAE